MRRQPRAKGLRVEEVDEQAVALRAVRDVVQWLTPAPVSDYGARARAGNEARGRRAAEHHGESVRIQQN